MHPCDNARARARARALASAGLQITVRVARLVAEESVQLHGVARRGHRSGGMITCWRKRMGDADFHLERFARGEPAFA